MSWARVRTTSGHGRCVCWTTSRLSPRSCRRSRSGAWPTTSRRRSGRPTSRRTLGWFWARVLTGMRGLRWGRWRSRSRRCCRGRWQVMCPPPRSRCPGRRCCRSTSTSPRSARARIRARCGRARCGRSWCGPSRCGPNWHGGSPGTGSPGRSGPGRHATPGRCTSASTTCDCACSGTARPTS